jgi:hypothetical protein
MGLSNKGGYMEKGVFHKNAKRYLKGLAMNILGLNEGQFEIRTCLGGPAVLGETVLHTDAVFHGKGIYAMVGDFKPADEKTVMMRTCLGRKDYTGGKNNYLTFEEGCTMARAIKSGTPFFLSR